MELEQLKLTQTRTDDETGLYNERGARLRPTMSSRVLDRGQYDDDDEVVLLNPLYAHPASKLRAAARCLARVETLSHIAFWKKAGSMDDDGLDLIELPRLRLSLTEKNGQLFSLDHADLAICSEAYLLQRPEVVRLITGMPHSLVLTNSDDEPQVSINS